MTSIYNIKFKSFDEIKDWTYNIYHSSFSFLQETVDNLEAGLKSLAQAQAAREVESRGQQEESVRMTLEPYLKRVEEQDEEIKRKDEEVIIFFIEDIRK